MRGRLIVVRHCVAQKICLQCEDHREPRKGGRGLCQKCYSRSRYLVTEGIETWESLVKRGLALPRLRPPHAESKEIRMRRAIQTIVSRGEYPSIVKINKEMGNKSDTFSPSEVQIRHALFRELRIEVKTQGSRIALC